jgi:L-asparaginase II
MTNPIIAEITRGGIVESRHRGAFVVSDTAGNIIASDGDIDRPVFPRSAIKAFQCLPVIESGAAKHFALTDAEIALCCASHNGEPEHVQTAQSILSKNGCSETNYECGAHYPTASAARDELVRQGEKPRQIHNNCSGKHAGMLTLARHLGTDSQGYIKPDHPVQKAIMAAMSEICSVDLANAPVGIDGCSVPTWAFPLRNMALGFARLCERPAGKTIIEAVRANPFHVGGSKSFDTELMQQLPRIFVKGGAEGVYCGCIPHAKLGFALKCDDGAFRAAEVGIAGVMLKLDCWTETERSTLKKFAHEDMRNWNKLHVGERMTSIG